LIENTLELICEFNNVFANTNYEKYIPLHVMLSVVEGTTMYCGSETLQAARIAGAIYQYLDEHGADLEVGGWPSIKVEVDCWTAILVTPEDQSHLTRDARKLLTSTAW
jgi:hypothetical protein